MIIKHWQILTKVNNNDFDLMKYTELSQQFVSLGRWERFYEDFKQGLV